MLGGGYEISVASIDRRAPEWARGLAELAGQGPDSPLHRLEAGHGPQERACTRLPFPLVPPKPRRSPVEGWIAVMPGVLRQAPDRPGRARLTSARP